MKITVSNSYKFIINRISSFYKDIEFDYLLDKLINKGFDREHAYNRIIEKSIKLDKPVKELSFEDKAKLKYYIEKSITWNDLGNNYFSSENLLLRVNNFPDEPMITLISKDDIIDLEEFPNNWRIITRLIKKRPKPRTLESSIVKVDKKFFALAGSKIFYLLYESSSEKNQPISVVRENNIFVDYYSYEFLYKGECYCMNNMPKNWDLNLKDVC